MCNPPSLPFSPLCTRAPLPFLDDTHPSVHLGRPAGMGYAAVLPRTEREQLLQIQHSLQTRAEGGESDGGRANKGPSALRANLTCISWSSDCDPIRLAREEGKENHLPPSLSTGRGREDHIRPQQRMGWEDSDTARKEKERLGSGRKSCL